MTTKHIVRKIPLLHRVSCNIRRLGNSAKVTAPLNEQARKFSTEPTSKEKTESTDEGKTDTEIGRDEGKRQERMKETGRYIIKDQVPVHGWKVDDYDRFILVYLGRYPSMAEVPNVVPQSKMKLARDLMRIRINILCILIFGVATFYTIGKYEKERKKKEAERMERLYGRRRQQ